MLSQHTSMASPPYMTLLSGGTTYFPTAGNPYAAGVQGRGVHSSTFQLNLNHFCGIRPLFGPT